MNAMRTTTLTAGVPVEIRSGDRHSPNGINATSEPERYEVLVLGSGAAGKLMVWTMAREGTSNIFISQGIGTEYKLFRIWHGLRNYAKPTAIRTGQQEEHS